MDNNIYEDEIDLIDLCRYLLSKIKIIIIVTIVGFIIGAGLGLGKGLFLTEKQYYSDARILFMTKNVSKSSNQSNNQSTIEGGTSYDINIVREGNNRDIGVDISTDSSSQSNSSSQSESMSYGSVVAESVQLLTSRTNIEKAIKTLDLEYEYADIVKDKNVVADVIKGTNIVNVGIYTNNSEDSQKMLEMLINDGLEQISNMYECQYYVIQEPTYNEEGIAKITLDSNGKIVVEEFSRGITKITIIVTLLFFVAVCGYYVCLYLFNNKLKDIDEIERRYKVKVITALSKDHGDIDSITTTIINSNQKEVLFTALDKETTKGREIVDVAKSLIRRKYKVLVVCVDSYDVLDTLKYKDKTVKNNINNINGIDVVTTTYLEYKDVVDNLKDEYDYILYEMINTEMSNDVFLMNNISLVLLVRYNSIEKGMFERVINNFRDAKTNILGIVFTEIGKESSSYKYVNKEYWL